MASTGEPFGLFWNSQDGDRTYDANSYEYWLKKFFTSGVFEGDLQVKSRAGMNIRVGEGYANVDGKVKFWNAPFELTLDAASSTYPRIDTVVITRDNVHREIRCEVVKGSYSGDIPQPTAPVRTAETYQLVLAQIYITNGATGITQADITDTRVNPNLCGYITGTVKELDFSQFVAQFEGYFNNFKVTSQMNYQSWFELVQSQQLSDKAAWDAWYAALQEELHNLPAESAEYLQTQINEIKESGTTGSTLHITTVNRELEGKTVTVVGDTETRTATFDSNLECTISGFKPTGTITITSTDGIQTAETTMSIMYYSRYEVPIAFWHATINIDGDEELAGHSVTVTDSDNNTVDTITLSQTGAGVFEARRPDTYNFIVTYENEDFVESLEVSEETTYSLLLSVGISYKRWLTLGGISPTGYSSLEDVFADEAAVRRLMLVHASADYLVNAVSRRLASIDAFVANDTAMKWIGLCDYVCDHLTSIEGVEAKFLASEYWERYLKDHVPVMTAASAPYGTAQHYQLFDNATYLTGSVNIGTSTSGASTYYEFTNPICVKAFEYAGAGVDTATNYYKTFTAKIEVSNDGSTWTEIGEHTWTVAEHQATFRNPQKYQIANADNMYAKYVRFRTTSSNYNDQNYNIVGKLQFYGRALNVSVPVMTSNTAPYGQAFASSYIDNNRQPYHAFDGVLSSGTGSTNVWHSQSGLPQFVGYKSGSPYCVKYVRLRNSSYHYGIKAAKLQGSNDSTNGTDGTWVDIGDFVDCPATGTWYFKQYDSNNDYLWYRLYITETNYQTYAVIDELQFYGVDYSEKEFEQGTTRKWLYDHGVMLDGLQWDDTSFTGASFTRSGSISEIYNGDGFRLQCNTGTNRYISRGSNEKISFTGKSLLRANISYGTTTGSNFALDISSINDSHYLGFFSAIGNSSNQLARVIIIRNKGTVMGDAGNIVATFNNTNNRIIEITELWLE